jgi:hypothetical protein
VNLGDAEGRTPLHLCCGSPLSLASEYQTTIVVASLLSHAASYAIKGDISRPVLELLKTTVSIDLFAVDVF